MFDTQAEVQQTKREITIPNDENHIDGKRILARKISGRITRIMRGYGFIKRTDTDEEIFVHNTALSKNEPKCYMHLLKGGEQVEFDVVDGRKGPAAVNVISAKKSVVGGSRDADDRVGPSRSRSKRRGGSCIFRGRQNKAEDQQKQQKMYKLNDENHIDGKRILARKVNGRISRIKENGYGFINRTDTGEDIFVHQTAISKNSPTRNLRSFEFANVDFDVVEGRKGPEAANVTRANESIIGCSKDADDRFGPIKGRRVGQQRGGSIINRGQQDKAADHFGRVEEDDHLDG